MNVRVRFWKDEAQGYASSRDYLYFTRLPLRIYDAVIAPTRSNPMQRAIVTQVNVPDSEISLSYAYNLKEITEYWREDAK